ncbi:MAG: 5-bromo-4-chloroindolyl phosphate hydrolysis family protein [Eubacteriales bacterium]|nr:5-bromo-4-chloroindolyl phosphate hydrolysis family protein [Eubacteriales bacterium]
MKDDHNKINEYGEQILDKITESIENADFVGLSEDIRQSVDFIRKEAEKGYQDFFIKSSREFEKYSKNLETPYERFRASWEENLHKQKATNSKGKTLGKTEEALARPKHIPVIKRFPGMVSGALEMALGIGTLCIFGGMSLAFGIMAAVGLTSSAALLGVSLPFTLVGGFLTSHGVISKKRAERLKVYNHLLHQKEFMMVDELVKQSGFSKKIVDKDIDFILKNHLIPQLSMDDKGTCLMFTDQARSQYKDAEMARIEREIEEIRQKQEEELRERKRAEASREERALYDFEDAMKAFLDETTAYKEEIDSEEMKEQITRIELILSQIHACVKEHPEMISGTGHLVSYYLPCMLKLLKTYEDIEEQPIQGDVIQKTKNEIESSFATIESALTDMYDELFRNVSMDISSDIQVLETMMAQDGLRGKIK